MYQRITENQEAVFDKFKALTKADLEAVNDLYEHYLFYEKSGKGRVCWTSCCHRKREYCGPDKQLVTPGDWEVLQAKHNEEMTCPYCGRAVTAKSTKVSGQCLSLNRYIPVVFLSAAEDGETIYAQAYWTNKSFRGRYEEAPRYQVTRVYRFSRGDVRMWEDTGSLYTGKQVMTEQKGRFILQPFLLQSDNQGYYILGMDCLQNSFLRYTGYETWGKTDGNLHTSMVRFLALAALYPENIEMMVKTSFFEPINQWIYERCKHAAIIRWGEKNPQKALGLSGKELREFMAGPRDLETLYVIKLLKKAGLNYSISGIEGTLKNLYTRKSRPRDIVKRCMPAKVGPEKLVRYLDRFTGGCHIGGYRDISMILGHWEDYMDAATAIGYDMAREVVVLPKHLEEAHDIATAEHRRRLQEAEDRKRAEADAELKKELEAAERKFKKRLKGLKEKYEMERGGFVITVPESAQEIINEGQSLDHCVGGYAQRHLEGDTTILFLRRKKTPEQSLCTIEMDKKRMVQVHGCHNERRPSPENPGMKPPRELYAEILEPFLAWVAAGSKRDKKGYPVVPKKKEKKEVSAA